MKTKSLILIGLFISTIAFSQQPFEKFGYQIEISTLSQGKYIEDFTSDSLVQVGSVMINRVTGKIASFITYDTVYSEATLDPQIISRWMQVDPLADERYSHSPYNFVQNNPINRVDPDGMLDEWAYNIETKELTWVSDQGGDEQQILHVVDGEGKPVSENSTAIVNGAEIHVTELENNNLFVSSYDPVSDIPEGYNTESGYSYNALDLKKRNELKDTPFESQITDAENSGKAQPIHSRNEVEAYEKKYGTRSSVFYAAEHGYFAPSGTSGIIKGVHSAISKFGGVSKATSKWKGVPPRSGRSNAWNNFLKKNKGKYKGKGWQKRAAQDYKNQKGG